MQMIMMAYFKLDSISIRNEEAICVCVTLVCVCVCVCGSETTWKMFNIRSNLAKQVIHSRRDFNHYKNYTSEKRLEIYSTHGKNEYAFFSLFLWMYSLDSVAMFVCVLRIDMFRWPATSTKISHNILSNREKWPFARSTFFWFESGRSGHANRPRVDTYLQINVSTSMNYGNFSNDK